MLTLCIDTAYRYLTCALIKDDKLIASESFECFKKQSEELLNTIRRVFTNSKINPKDIDSICISDGPGSYTGIRIAMSLAKTIGQILPCDVYTISTLRLYASLNKNTLVILNARADRAYVGIYDENKIVLDDCVLCVNDIITDNYSVVGDGSLVGKSDLYPKIDEAFLKTKKYWKKVNDIAYLVPKYLKESESYLK